jgi:CRP/FNR family cyclic AMP-dependent transcriptional regulator
MDPDRLTAIPIFSQLSPEETKRLAAFATETSAPSGQVLIREGDFSIELIAIEEGTADVFQGGQKIASLHPGDLIGEMGLLERERRKADVIATSPMRLLKLTHWEIRRMSDSTLDRIKDIIAERRTAGVADPADPADPAESADLGDLADPADAVDPADPADPADPGQLAT